MRTTGPEMRVQSKGTWLPAGGGLRTIFGMHVCDFPCVFSPFDVIIVELVP